MATVEHITHDETVTQHGVPHSERPQDSLRSSLKHDLRDCLDTPTNALGIEMSITPPPPSLKRSDSSSPSRKCKSPAPEEEPEFDQARENQEYDGPKSLASPTSPKKSARSRRQTRLPRKTAQLPPTQPKPVTRRTLCPENAVSSETAIVSSGPALVNGTISANPSTPIPTETVAARRRYVLTPACDYYKLACFVCGTSEVVDFFNVEQEAQDDVVGRRRRNYDQPWWHE